MASLNLLFYIGHYRFQVLRITNGYYTQSIPKHSHSSYEIHYVEEGFGHVLVENGTYSLSPNTLYVTGPNFEHEQCSDYTPAMKEFSFYCNVTLCGNPTKLSKEDAIVSNFLNTSFWIGQDNHNLKFLIEQLEAEMQHHYVGYSIVIKSIFEQFIIGIIRNYSCYPLSLEDLPKPNLLDNRFIIIENSFLNDYRNITLDILSKRIGLSSRQTSRILQHFYQSTFQKKKLEARMIAAMSLLTQSPLSISQIAEETGFSSLEYFCNTFKRFYGKSASSYRN